MKYLALFFLLCGSVASFAPVTLNGNISLNGNATSGRTAGGPNAWYDVETFANTDTDDFTLAAEQAWSPVTVGQAGLATKARIRVTTRFGDCIIKMALYDATGTTLLASGSLNCTAGNQYWEIPFSSPVAVSATGYLLAWAEENGNYLIRYKASSGNCKLNNSGSGYAGFPPASLPSPDFDLARGYAVSLFVQ